MQAILNELIDRDFELLVADTQELIRIPSVLDESEAKPGSPFGEAIRVALDLALNKADKMGFKTKNVDGYAGYAELGDSGDQVGILAHLDVVPAAGDWIVPPFAGNILENKLYGRGSVDDKGPGMACLYAMKAIKESGLPFSKRARLIWGTDEETLARGIYYYLDKEENPLYGFSPDAEFPIVHAEKGTIRFMYHLPCADADILAINAGTRLNVVPNCAHAKLSGVTEKALIGCAEKAAAITKTKFTFSFEKGYVLVTADGLASHACYPEEGVNAIQGLLVLLNELFPDADSPLKKSLHAFASSLKDETDGKSMRVACSDEISGSLTLNTAILDVNENGGVIKFDIRYPVTRSGNEIIDLLTGLESEAYAKFELIQHKPPLHIEKNSHFIKLLQRAYEDCTGQEPRCISIGGGTYCRYIKNTVSFGPVFPGQKELAHQCNEFIDLDNLKMIAKIYAQAIYNLIE